MTIAHRQLSAYSRATPDASSAADVRSGPVWTEAIIASEHEIRASLAQYLGRLWRYGIVLSRQRDVADDLVQATCVRALERASQFTSGTRLDRWLFSIMHSIWLNEVRSRRIRMGNGFVDADLTLSFDGEHETETHVTANQVLRQVNELPEAQRTAVFLAYVEGLSYREVAEVLDVPIGTVMSRLATARAKLAEHADPDVKAKQMKGGK
ncbi:RNA polymerase sigma-70 factor (ECF subfamily) [Phyllobacterium sp. 1468]|uniref:RNA polymerase sigma factor n=1 Tax=Phyllobacterium sp. 1468 TaxID=2817759 RepID=UPI0028586152|nr:RNA polymerase sigma-70 factor (ECF subfamily) [Phyllobacterium sp. 1468]